MTAQHRVLDPGFTESELRVMRVFWSASKPLSQLDVCEITGISKGYMQYLLPELCDRCALREVSRNRGSRGIPGLYVAERLRVHVNTQPWDARLREAIDRVIDSSGVMV